MLGMHVLDQTLVTIRKVVDYRFSSFKAGKVNLNSHKYLCLTFINKNPTLRRKVLDEIQ